MVSTQEQVILARVRYMFFIFLGTQMYRSRSWIIFSNFFTACLADEELQAEEESIEELRRKAEEERFRAQLEAQQREEERRKEEERR